MRGNFQGSKRLFSSTPYSNTHGGRGWAPSTRPNRTIPPALGSTLSKLEVDDLEAEACSPAQAKITDCHVVSSYNLMGKDSTTILVPGAPPAYTPPAQPAQLQDDAGGEYFREENAARFPKHPMQPAVQAVFTQHPDFDTAKVDVFACASTTGNLVQTVLGKNQPFCLVVHVVGDTAFFMRREHSPTELIEGVMGFGHAFPEAYTTWTADVKGSSSHQRVLKYNFGGLQYLVRYESDGCLGEQPKDESKQQCSPNLASVEDILADLMKQDEASPAAIGNVVKICGHQADQSDVFDLKTRSIRKLNDDIVGEELPRLWVRQVSNFILAFHTSGVFNDIRVEDVGEKVRDWEAQSSSALCNLGALVNNIVTLAQQQSNRKLEVRGAESGKLEFCEVDGDGWDALPRGLAAKWAQQDDSGGNEDVRDDDAGNSDHDSFYLGRESEHDDDDDDDENTKDFTACSADDCGYCGRCMY